MTYNYLIAGVGGQGTVLASRLIAAAAMKRGYNVRTAETIGMAQRGGSVVSHIRIGTNVHSPLMPLGSAHALIAFEPAEAARCMTYLAPGGRLVVCDSAIKPVAGALSGDIYDVGNIIEYLKNQAPGPVFICGRAFKDRCGRTLNVALLGVAAQSGAFPFGAEALVETIAEMPRYGEQNIQSFEYGRRTYDENCK